MEDPFFVHCMTREQADNKNAAMLDVSCFTTPDDLRSYIEQCATRIAGVPCHLPRDRDDAVRVSFSPITGLCAVASGPLVCTVHVTDRERTAAVRKEVFRLAYGAMRTDGLPLVQPVVSVFAFLSGDVVIVEEQPVPGAKPCSPIATHAIALDINRSLPRISVDAERLSAWQAGDRRYISDFTAFHCNKV